MLKQILLFACLGLVAVIPSAAHPGEEETIHPLDVNRRQLEANRRHVMARNCAPQVSAFNMRRKLKRDLVRRGLVDSKKPAKDCTSEAPSSTLTANQPTYSQILNNTCVTVPEVTEGPYYIRGELVRTDLREVQAGVTLLMDIGVMDTTTCTPLADALVELWHCNATGSYAGFTSAGGGGGPPPPASGSVSASLPPSTDSASAPIPSGPPGGPGGPPSQGLTDNEAFCRGGYATNSEGMVEFKTIYPGFYTGRTIHIHTLVQTNYTVLENGTIASGAGDTHHIGQIFFEETLNDLVVALPTYSNTTQRRTLNVNDGILQQENSDGYNAFAQAELLGADVSEGVLAYITIGVDTTRHVNISTTNYATTFLHPGSAVDPTGV